MIRRFVFTAKTTQPRPQIFAIDRAIIWQLCCTIDVISSHIAKLFQILWRFPPFEFFFPRFRRQCVLAVRADWFIWMWDHFVVCFLIKIYQSHNTYKITTLIQFAQYNKKLNCTCRQPGQCQRSSLSRHVTPTVDPPNKRPLRHHPISVRFFRFKLWHGIWILTCFSSSIFPFLSNFIWSSCVDGVSGISLSSSSSDSSNESSCLSLGALGVPCRVKCH